MRGQFKGKKIQRLRANDAFVAAGRTIEELLLRVMHGGNEYLIPTIIANCGILIEGTLNDAYVSFFEGLKKRQYRDVLDSFLQSPFYLKFRLLPLLLSDWKYQWNFKDPLVQKIFELMRLQNRMLHAYHPPRELAVFEFEGFITIPDHDQFPYYRRGTKGKITELEVNDWVDIARTFNARFRTLALNMLRKDFSRMEQSHVFTKFV